MESETVLLSTTTVVDRVKPTSTDESEVDFIEEAIAIADITENDIAREEETDELSRRSLF